MGLEKGIEHKKEKRLPYRNSKAFDRTCRNHGGCPYCEESRTRQQRDLNRIAKEEVDEQRSTEDIT